MGDQAIESRPIIADAFENFSLQSWDPAVFKLEFLHHVYSRSLKEDGFTVREGHYNTTSKALTAAYRAVLQTYNSYFDVAELSSSLPMARSVEEKQHIYKYTTSDGFPPHLQHIPEGETATQDDLFGNKEIKTVTKIVYSNYNGFTRAVSAIPFVTPRVISDFKICKTFEELEKNNAKLRASKQWSEPNIGDREDWFTDEVFAQQQFTGTNPTTLELASTEWIARFRDAANDQMNQGMVDLINAQASQNSLYVQDCSYFRDATDTGATDIMSVGAGWFSKNTRWQTATVSLYHLDGLGRLHPLAIVIDYKQTMKNSVTIFNKRLTAEAPGNQRDDWPWRYAKTCAQSSDWLRHEVQVHLVNTHLIEESLIVAAQRNLPADHLVFRALSPHWFRTLPLNAAARATLVPHVVVPVCGVEEDKAMKFVNHAFKNFDFVGQYVPNDLKRRGFPLEKLGDERCRCDKHCKTLPGDTCQVGCGNTCHRNPDKKFHNYAYGRNMLMMWDVLRSFVRGYLAYGGDQGSITSDKDVINDKHIQSWAEEIRTTGGIPSFPQIDGVDSLIDAVTMCIHIASPQHTAINYLQEYYQSFVAARPPAMCTAPPTSLKKLMGFTESDVIAALPADRPTEWLLASHVAALLSLKVAEELNLINYAKTVYNAAEWKAHYTGNPGEVALQQAAKDLIKNLWTLGDSYDSYTGEKKKGIFTLHSEQLDDKQLSYMVMDPVVTAVSILL